jgi:hypothetical protein
MCLSLGEFMNWPDEMQSLERTRGEAKDIQIFIQGLDPSLDKKGKEKEGAERSTHRNESDRRCPGPKKDMNA